MNLHVIELPQLRGQRHVDGVESPRHHRCSYRVDACRCIRPKFDFHTGPCTQRRTALLAWCCPRRPRTNTADDAQTGCPKSRQLARSFQKWEVKRPGAARQSNKNRGPRLSSATPTTGTAAQVPAPAQGLN